jgi:hypothetical protein
LIDHLIGSTRLARLWGYLGDANHPDAVHDFTNVRWRADSKTFASEKRG